MCTWYLSLHENSPPIFALIIIQRNTELQDIDTFRNPTNTQWIQYFVSNIMVLLMSDFRFSVFGLFAVIISWLLSSLYLATAVVSSWLLLFQNGWMNVRFDVSKVVLLKMQIFWNAAVLHLLSHYWHSEGTMFLWNIGIHFHSDII
jgi:hypothetical protein